jgi:xylulokinase
MNFLGIDVGSSSIKVALVSGKTLKPIGYSQSPDQELEIIAHRAGWAEQDPESWWKHLKLACENLKAKYPSDYQEIQSIGISYQMHGLVLTDENIKPIRPSIIWCDSRAVEIGEKAFSDLGKENCLARYLNSPGNFTASKLAWVKENEPSIYSQARYAMLPGDYIAARLTGEVSTTISGLSEGVLWDFIQNKPAHALITYFDFDEKLFPKAGLSFGHQGSILDSIASELGLPKGTKLGYRAGDQPNNAFALGVMEPGQVGANAGTSGVIYGINNGLAFDPQSRVNCFAHVNHTADNPRIGVLACLNGTGIFYSWVRKLISSGGNSVPDYELLNKMAETVHPGSDHLRAYPFGNGAERFLNNQNPGGSFSGLNFNVHTPAHLVRATLEGIVFALHFGFEILKEMHVDSKVVKAGKANLFLSPLFRQIFVDVTQTELQFVDSNGSLGAAIGGAVGLGLIKEEDWKNELKPLATFVPDTRKTIWYSELYQKWKSKMDDNV